MKNEKWKSLDGFNGLYEISNKGRFRSFKRSNQTNIHSGYDNGSGYKKVALWNDNKVKYEFIHRLVADAFIPNPENKPCVNHIDANPSNNDAENLEWCTQKENLQHASKSGLLERSVNTRNKISDATKGENHGQSKLTEVDVLEIRSAYELGALQKELAEAYGIRQDHISRIVNRKMWAHL